MLKFNFEKVKEINNVNTLKEKGIEKLDFLLSEKLEMTGWVKRPINYDKNEFLMIKEIAEEIKSSDEVLVVIGIGGSYLGSKAAISFLSNYFKRNGIEIIFAGTGLSEKYLSECLNYVKNKDFYINVISKSGGTLEPAVAFNKFKDLCEAKYGKEGARKRIIATTDKEKGVLKEQANKEGYRTLVVPDDIGGRYSVLSAVGLLPIAAAGYDIDKLMEGGKKGYEKYTNKEFEKNPAIKYAIIRNLYYNIGKRIEVFSVLSPNMQYFSEWLKQLFGESECKEGKGIFPASLLYTADLHSMGQLMQQGERNMFETFIMVEDDFNNDRIKYNKNLYIDDLNDIALRATEKAHYDGGVPIIEIKLEKQNEETLGELFYFFMISCGISALLLGVDPFNQPGVEEYKKNIKKLLN